MWTLEWWWRFFVLSIILYKRISCCWSWINKKGSEDIELCNELHTISAGKISFPWHPLFNELATFKTLPRRRKMDKLADLISVKIERDGLSRVCVLAALRRRRLLIIEDIRRFICSGAIKLYAFFFRTRRAKNLWPQDSGRRLRADLLPRVWRLTCPLINKCEWNIFSPNQSNFMLFDVGEIFVTVLFLFFLSLSLSKALY